MTVLRRLAPRTIAAQITCIVIVSVLLGVGLASSVVFALFSNLNTSANQDIMAAGRAARIAAIVHKAEALRSPKLLPQVLDTYRSSSLNIELIPLDRVASNSGWSRG